MDIKAEYINLYNNSLDEYLIQFCDKFSFNHEQVMENYKYVHKTKISAYMLFVKHVYSTKGLDPNNKFKFNSKIISKQWKNITEEDKKPFEVEALRLKKKYGLIKVPKKKKIKERVVVSEEYKREMCMREDDFSLKEVTINDRIYYIDSFSNIIDGIGNYVGYVNDGEYVFLLS